MSNKILLSTIVAAVTATVLNAAIFIFGSNMGVDWAVTGAPVPNVTLGAVIVASLATALVAGLCYWLWNRTLGDSSAWGFFIIATIIGLLSLLSPLNQANSFGTMMLLNLMHIVSTMAITYNLTVGDWEGIGSVGAILR